MFRRRATRRPHRPIALAYKLTYKASFTMLTQSHSRRPCLTPASASFLRRQSPLPVSRTLWRQIDRFVSITPVDRSKFPTASDWWRHNHRLYPNVARVAKCYLCTPLTSVASERLFSLASRVFTDRRDRLAPKKADCCCLLSTTCH